MDISYNELPWSGVEKVRGSSLPPFSDLEGGRLSFPEFP